MGLRARAGLPCCLALGLAACAGPAAAPEAKVVRLPTDDWSSQTLAGDHRLAALWVDAGGTLWAAGQGAVVRWDGEHPPEVTEVKGALTALWGASPTDVWAVGSDGARGHFDGTAWTMAATDDGGPAAGPLFALWGAGPSDVWAAGEAILRWDGKAWSPLASPNALWIRGIWGSAPDDVWLAAAAAPLAEVSGGAILHWDGKALTSALETPEPLQAVWGSSSKDVWVVGASPVREDAAAHSVLRHFDGSAWSESARMDGVELLSLWGAGPRDVWSAGLGGQAMRFDGAQWAPVPIGSKQDLAAGARSAATTFLLSPSGELLSRDVAAKP